MNSNNELPELLAWRINTYSHVDNSILSPLPSHFDSHLYLPGPFNRSEETTLVSQEKNET